MIAMVRCDFCGAVLEKGMGKKFVKKDGRTLDFCSNKCEKNMFKLKRKPREHKWTRESRKARGKE